MSAFLWNWVWTAALLIGAVLVLRAAFGRRISARLRYALWAVALVRLLVPVSLPAVEVHLSDVSAREDFRQISYVRMACRRTFAGHGFQGYRMAAEALLAEKNGASEGEKE